MRTPVVDHTQNAFNMDNFETSSSASESAIGLSLTILLHRSILKHWILKLYSLNWFQLSNNDVILLTISRY